MIRNRRLVESGSLPHELQPGLMDLSVCRWVLTIVDSPDFPAHMSPPLLSCVCDQSPRSDFAHNPTWLLSDGPLGWAAFLERPMPQSPAFRRCRQIRDHQVERRSPTEARLRVSESLSTAGFKCLHCDSRLHRRARELPPRPRAWYRHLASASELSTSFAAWSPPNIHQGRIADALDAPLVIGGGTDVSYQHQVDSTGVLAHRLSTVALSVA